MKKGMLVSTALIMTLFATSCGAPKELGTFESELQAGQDKYVANISKYFSEMQGYSQGKFISTSNVDVDANIPKILDAGMKVVVKGNTILENETLALDMDMDMSVNGNISKDTKNPQLLPVVGANGEASMKATIGMTNDILLFNVKEMDFDASGNEQITTMVSEYKTQFNFVKAMFVDKWFSLELPEEAKKELMKSVALNAKTIEMIQEVLTMMVKGDIFTKAEKTTYEGQAAYKFSIDEKKAAAHFVKVAKVITEKYSDVFAMYNLSAEDLAEQVKVLEQEVMKEENFKTPQIMSEIYMTRAKDGGVNFIMTKFGSAEQPEEGNLTLSIVDGVVKIGFSGPDGSFDSIFTKKGDTIEFSGSVMEKELKVADFSGDYTAKNKGSQYDSKMKLDINIAPNKDSAEEVFKEGATIKIMADSITKKDNSITITKESITDNAKEILPLGDLMQGFGAGALGGGVFGATQELDYNEEGLEEAETTDDETVQMEDLEIPQACNSYLEYLTCTYKEAGLDESAIVNNIDTLKTSWSNMGADQIEGVCNQSIEIIKANNVETKCSL